MTSAISLKNVSVAYRSYKEWPSTLKETILRFLTQGKLKHYSTFDALSHINLEIEAGTTVALIGSNGSGKSTLLKVIAQVLEPSSGDITVQGTIASLIELGVGFDPELNAIENIYLNGSLHKKSKKELVNRIPHIIDFAELHEFVNTPIKYYSSGMAARLGFSAAMDINPDILLVDEILAVGDERFQQKCNGVFERFLKEKKTVILVSHDLSMVEHLAQRAILLSKGKIIFDGAPSEAIRLYRDGSYQAALQ